jgi:nickel-dependent lactate racemase
MASLYRLMADFQPIQAFEQEAFNMQEHEYLSKGPGGITDIELSAALRESLADQPRLKKVLLIPPDLTRMHSGAGKITAHYYDLLHTDCQVDILPALGTHDPMSEQELRHFFGSRIPLDHFIAHNWRTDVVKVGEVPGDFITEVSEGRLHEPIEIAINRTLLDPSYDLIISIGQVVPHEVIGMANYSKNIFVGCGGSDAINKTHMLGAVYGMERIMGRDHSPVRKVFDYAETRLIKDLPLMYVLTVTTQTADGICLHGLFTGRSRRIFEQAVQLSQQINLIYVSKPLQKVVVYLDEREFKSTWLGNKAVYRTRMAIADDGELLILAPGVRKFGEDGENDRLIRRYGYVGRDRVLEKFQAQAELKANASVAAHLIHGSSDGRFKITYAVRHLTRSEVEGAGFAYLDLAEAMARYNPQDLAEGLNIMPDGEEIFYISNPALGLWIYKGEK